MCSVNKVHVLYLCIRVLGLPADFKEGVVFSTYATLVSSVQRGKMHVHIILWNHLNFWKSILRDYYLLKSMLYGNFKELFIK